MDDSDERSHSKANDDWDMDKRTQSSERTESDSVGESSQEEVSSRSMYATPIDMEKATTCEKDPENPAGIPQSELEKLTTDGKRLIFFGKNDPEKACNWPLRYRSWVAALGILLVFNATLASTSASGISTNMEQEFGIGQTVNTLITSLFLCGYCVGPFLWSPMSEYLGRYPATVGAFGGYIIFAVATALSPNIGAMLAFRFLAGFCAACPLSVSGAMFADVFEDPVKRGRTIALMGFITMAAPTLNPSITGYISTSAASWRWAFWAPAIVSGVTGVIHASTYRETFPPVLLSRKARRISKETGEGTISVLDHGRNPKQIFYNAFTRPFRLVIEPIVFSISLYLAFIYGVFYGFFEAYPIIFQGVYGFAPGPAGLLFIPVLVGAGAAYTIMHVYIGIMHGKEKHKHKHYSPERARLTPSLFAGPFLVIGLLCLGWTAYTYVHYLVPSILGGVFFGCGFSLLFMSFFNYITDIYGVYAASALGVTSILRSAFGAFIPLVIPFMYDAMGVHWASTLLAGIALVLVPIPFVFMKFGARIRARSKLIETS